MDWRSAQETIAKTFIKPGDVIDLANEIIKMPTEESDVRGDVCEKAAKALRWVHTNITYTSDLALSGHFEFWQEPYWTIQVGHGDCDDMAWLLASILMVYGGDVRVLYGTMRSRLHIWVEHRMPPDEFVILESTNGQVYPAGDVHYHTIEVLFDSREWRKVGW